VHVHLRHLRRVHQLRHQVAQLVHRDREPDVLRVAADGGVDADHLSVRVEQGPARVARVDRRVRLYQVGQQHVAVRGLEVPVHGRDDPGAHAVAEPHRVADGDDRLADHQVAAVAQGQGLERPVALDLQHRQVGLRVAADQVRVELPPVGQLHLDLAGTVDNVVIGDEVAVLVDEEAAAQRVGRHAHDVAQLRPVPEQVEAAGQLPACDELRGGDVHHRRLRLLHHLDRHGAAQVDRLRRLGGGEVGARQVRAEQAGGTRDEDVRP
jgi:hypothetical protein